VIESEVMLHPSKSDHYAAQSMPGGRICPPGGQGTRPSAVLAVLFAGWLAAGDLRAESLARDYFAHAHEAGTVTNVTVDAVSPGLPPFWGVKISGDVTEAGATTPAYRSTMRLWIEPLSGFVPENGAGQGRPPERARLKVRE
jgi:hypothetical protein